MDDHTLYTIRRLMEDIATRKAALAELARWKMHAERAILTEAQRAELDSIDATYRTESDPLLALQRDKEDELKSHILRHEASVKHAGLHAVYVKGRITWDAAKLEGYAMAHPEINAAKTVAKPTVSIREVS